MFWREVLEARLAVAGKEIPRKKTEIRNKMVQEFNVLSCFSCGTFQVDQVKKSTNKWTCKLCGEKQSIKQIFFKGNGKECRMQVQQLNLAKCMHNQVESANACCVKQRTTRDESDQGQIHDHAENELPKYLLFEPEIMLDKFEKRSKPLTKRWEQFVETQEDHNENEHEDHSSINITTERSCFEESRRMTKRQRHQSPRGNKYKPYQQRKSQQDSSNSHDIQNYSTAVKRRNETNSTDEISKDAIDMNRERWSIDKEEPNLQKSHYVGNGSKQYSETLVQRAQTSGKDDTGMDMTCRAAQSSRWNQFISAPQEEDCSDNEEELY